MMKKLIILFCIIFWFINAKAQFPYKQSLGNPSTLVYSKGGLGTDSVFVLVTQFTDTAAANLGFLDGIAGAIIRTTGDSLWMRNNNTTAWTQINGGGGGGSGVTTMGAIGSSPNANGATISGVTLTLQPASASFGGLVTTGTQSFAGAKTFANDITLSGNVNFTGSVNSSLSGSNARIPSHTASNITFTNAGLISIGSANNGGVSDGHVLLISNHTGNSITIVNNYGGAAAGEIIYTGAGVDVTILNHASFWLQYNSTMSAWVYIGSSSIPGGSNGQIQYNNAGVFGGATTGTGVLTALGVNIGSPGAFVTFNGALGTPSSGTLTNATGLPPTTGIVGWPVNSAGVLTNDGAGNLTWGAAGGTTWNGITSPTGAQALTFQAGENSVWTDQNTTADLFTVNNATQTTASMFSLNRTSTAITAGNNIMEIISSGTNANSAAIATGLSISVTNTHASAGTNKALVLSASGAPTLNTALEVTLGRVGILQTAPQAMLHVGPGAAASAFGTAAQIIVSNGGSDAFVTLLGSSSGEVFIGTSAGSGVLGTITNNSLLFRTNNTLRGQFTTAGTLLMSYGVVEKQGADVASANNLALGADGNLFEITGGVQINLISSTNWQNGMEVTLQFTTNVTVKNGQATSGSNITILLAGAADFSATADDLLTLKLGEIGGVQAWREKCRSVN